MKSVVAVGPKLTPVAPVKLVPVMVTAVPAAGGPATGLTELTLGHGLVGELVGRRGGARPAGVVTVTSTVPAGPAGEVTVIWCRPG